ncbi:MAG: hypothetical protein IPI65_11075 [Bacteroidetes bacterium]|nr:hypothetical protein [Bacteroidota bacterium]
MNEGNELKVTGRLGFMKIGFRYRFSDKNEKLTKIMAVLAQALTFMPWE